MYYLKYNPSTVTYDGTKIKLDPDPSYVIDSPNLPRVTELQITIVARPLLTPVVQRLWRCGHGTFKSRTCVDFRLFLGIEIICCSS